MNHPQMCAFSHASMTFCSCDLDLDLMTLMHELDLDIPSIPKEIFLGQGFQKLEHEQDKHTDRQTDETKHIISRICRS